jgi:hypothetical protein
MLLLELFRKHIANRMIWLPLADAAYPGSLGFSGSMVPPFPLSRGSQILRMIPKYTNSKSVKKRKNAAAVNGWCCDYKSWRLGWERLSGTLPHWGRMIIDVSDSGSKVPPSPLFRG